MSNKIFRFIPRDPHCGLPLGPERYVHISTYDDNRIVVNGSGEIDDTTRGKIDELSASVEKLYREPTHEEFGTTDDMAYHYHKAIGQHPRGFADFFDADRAWTTTPFHILTVVEFAQRVNALDSLYRSLSNLACRPDELPVFMYDSPRSLFWMMVSAEEHVVAKANMATVHDYLIPRKMSGRYHGGLIAHQNTKDGTWEYAVHT